MIFHSPPIFRRQTVVRNHDLAYGWSVSIPANLERNVATATSGPAVIGRSFGRVSIGLAKYGRHDSHTAGSWSNPVICEPSTIPSPCRRKCERQDSNLHGLPHWILNPARLPIPPLSQAMSLRRC